MIISLEYQLLHCYRYTIKFITIRIQQLDYNVTKKSTQPRHVLLNWLMSRDNHLLIAFFDHISPKHTNFPHDCIVFASIQF